MLSKRLSLSLLFFVSFLLFSKESFSSDLTLRSGDINVINGTLQVKEPFTSAGIAFFDIDNGLPEELKITGFRSPSFRRIDIFEIFVDERGIETRKPVDYVFLRGLEVTGFTDSVYQVHLLGFDGKIPEGVDIPLEVDIENHGTFKTYLRTVYPIKIKSFN